MINYRYMLACFIVMASCLAIISVWELVECKNYISRIEGDLSALEIKLKNSQKEILRLEHELKEVKLANEKISTAKGIKPLTVHKKRITSKHVAIITAYTTSKKECGKTDRITSNNTIAIPWLTAAVGTDLKKYIGTHYVYIKRLDRSFEINDSKDKNLKGVDICVNTVKEANDIGRFKSDVVIIKK